MSNALAAISTSRRLRSAQSIILFSTCYRLLGLVCMRTSVGRLQFLELELIRALRYNALAFVETGQDGDLIAHLVSHADFASFKLLTGEQHVDDLLTFVLQHSLFGNQHRGDLFACVKTNIGLHTESQSATVVG